jgi:hypothetical protein
MKSIAESMLVLGKLPKNLGITKNITPLGAQMKETLDK